MEFINLTLYIIKETLGLMTKKMITLLIDSKTSKINFNDVKKVYSRKNRKLPLLPFYDPLSVKTDQQKTQEVEDYLEKFETNDDSKTTQTLQIHNFWYFSSLFSLIPVFLSIFIFFYLITLSLSNYFSSNLNGTYCFDYKHIR